MAELSKRLVQEHNAMLDRAVANKVGEDSLHPENVAPLLERFETLGLVDTGRFRAHWLAYGSRYCPIGALDAGLIGDLLLALAMMARISRSEILLFEDGVVEFERNHRIIAAYIIISGCGHRGSAAIEAEVSRRHTQHRRRSRSPNGAIVGGTSDVRPFVPTPPKDVARGNGPTYDVVSGPSRWRYAHVSDLRQNADLVRQFVP